MRKLVTICVIGLLALAGFDVWVSTTKLPNLTPSTSDMVYDRNDRLLAAFLTPDDYWRFDVQLDEIDPIYIKLLVAYEDKRFYQHNGVDYRALLRATGQFLTHGKIRSGGSTLTMQVTRLTERLPTRSFTAKLRQIRLALALERKLSKADILRIYLKLAPFGGNVEGIAAASYTYLGKAPHRLTPAQAALLVAIPQSPNQRRPDRKIKQAQAARDTVLRRAQLAGVINAEDLNTALSEPLSAELQPIPRSALHIAQKNRKNVDKLTLDMGVQQKAERLFTQKIEALGPRISGAVLIADYQTGEIISYVGSPDFTSERRLGYIDMATAIRSPGSTLKPFIYAKAFADGILHPQTLIADLPTRFGQYEPSNFDGKYKGMMTAHNALIGSRNIPAVSILDKVGVNQFSALLKRAGMDLVVPQNDSPGLAIALGGVGVSLRQLVQAYGGLANGGQTVDLHEIGQSAQKSLQFINPNAAFMTTEILRTNPSPSSAWNGTIAHKTGTSYGHRDSWAIGYDGKHVIGVLIGRADNTAIPGAFGAELATPILFQMFDIIGPVKPPQNISTTTTTVLPPHLRQFGTLNDSKNNVAITFPPAGASVEVCPPGMVVKFNGGMAPYRLVLNDKLDPKQYYQRSVIIPVTDDGFYNLSIIDAHATVSSQRFLASVSTTCQ